MSNRHPGIQDPARECREQLAPFQALMASWQRRFRPFSLEWLQISHVQAELSELVYVLNDHPRAPPFGEAPRAQNDA